MRYITREQLADLIKQPDKVPHKDYIVIDVRDDDRRGGHIKGSLNQPSEGFLLHVDQLVTKTKDIPLIVFHCALSQLRGPKMARIYEEVRQQNLSNDIDHEVVILRHGFSEFQSKYKDDPELVEDWDASFWGDEWDVDDTEFSDKK
ncbi:hypothetical protein AX16_008024 [Volvariella volvacea WC 439]|nr:hypothetical protein AX16_008024 [Volvariella volvacea WC 439]